jgi:hypothetical protein
VTGNTADVTGGKPIAVFLPSISGVSAINPLVTFYDIHGRKREVRFFLSRTPHETTILLYSYNRHIEEAVNKIGRTDISNCYNISVSKWSL